MTNDKSAALYEKVVNSFIKSNHIRGMGELLVPDYFKEGVKAGIEAALTPDAKDETRCPHIHKSWQTAETDEKTGFYCDECGERILRQHQAVAEPIEPVAYSYELATTLGSDGYSDFEPALTRYEPCVPACSIRNMRPLYAISPAKDATSEELFQRFIKENDSEDYPFKGEEYDMSLIKYVLDWVALSRGKD